MRSGAPFVVALASIGSVAGACYEPYGLQAEDLREVERTTPHPDVESGTADAEARDAADGGADGDFQPSRRCDPRKAFRTPKLVEGVDSTELDADGRLSADETTLYFTSERGTQPSRRNRVWRATRLGPGWSFAAPTVAVDESSVDFYDPTLSPDELTMVLQRTSTDGTDARLHYATRATTGDPFVGFTASLRAATARSLPAAGPRETPVRAWRSMTSCDRVCVLGDSIVPGQGHCPRCAARIDGPEPT